jgi:YD repeat-containing protein
MVFGRQAADNILPWLHMNFSQKFLIQSDDLLLSHPQNIQWRYTYDHARNYVETFRAIMNLLEVESKDVT